MAYNGYAIDADKLRRELGWTPAHTDFAEGLVAHHLCILGNFTQFLILL